MAWVLTSMGLTWDVEQGRNKKDNFGMDIIKFNQKKLIESFQIFINLKNKRLT